MNLTDLTKRSYSPYSQQPHIAVVKSEEGTYFPGVRIENISFPLTIPAPQNALFNCLSEGHQPRKVYLDDESSESTASQFWIKEFNLEKEALDTLGDDIDFFPVARQLEDDEIRPALIKLQNKALVDYSNFAVSALLKTESGYFSGVNIELEDWSRGLCAERVALAKALSYGATDFQSLHIYTQKGEYNSPCGACRQVICEHLSHHPVYLHHANGTTATHFSDHLLPYSFQSTTLKKESN